MGRGKQFMAVTSSLPSSLLPLICGIVLLVNVAGVVRRRCGAKRAQKTGKVFCWQWFLKLFPSCVPSSHDSAGVRAVVVWALLGIFPCSSWAGGRSRAAFLLPVLACMVCPPSLVPGLKLLLGACALPCRAGSRRSAAAPCNLSPNSVWWCRVPVPPPCISQTSLTGVRSRRAALLHEEVGEVVKALMLISNRSSLSLGPCRGWSWREGVFVSQQLTLPPIWVCSVLQSPLIPSSRIVLLPAVM